MRAVRFSVMMAAFAFSASCGFAQLAPLFAGNTNAILDEFDHVVKGSGDNPGDLVQVLLVTNGVFAPAVDGTPSSNNPVVVEGRIGRGVDPSLGDAGLFSEAIQGLDRGQSYSSGSELRVVARVFNAPQASNASFYGDSQIYSVPTFGSNYGVFVANIQKTAVPLDTNDVDVGGGDGLNNSWEKSLGTDPLNPDTDGDGMSDGAEFRAGTNPTNGLSLLLCVQLQRAGGPDLRVFWDSVTGKAYRVERTLDNLSQSPVFTNVSTVITASTLVTETIITNGLLDPNAHYRVRLVESPEL